MRIYFSKPFVPYTNTISACLTNTTTFRYTFIAKSCFKRAFLFLTPLKLNGE